MAIILNTDSFKLVYNNPYQSINLPDAGQILGVIAGMRSLDLIVLCDSSDTSALVNFVVLKGRCSDIFDNGLAKFFFINLAVYSSPLGSETYAIYCDNLEMLRHKKGFC